MAHPGTLLAQEASGGEGHVHGARAKDVHGEADDGSGGGDRGGEEGQDHHEGLHFTHPLIAESVSPDTKIRLDHSFFEFPDGDEESSGNLEAEYAFTRGFSLEVGFPYSYTEGEPGNLEVLLKFANFDYEEKGLLLGYGLELTAPTNGDAGEDGEPPIIAPASRSAHASRSAAASRAAAGSRVADAPLPPRFSGGGAGVEGTLGTDEWEVAPFLNLGWKTGRLELVAWTLFGIPFDQEEEDEVTTELSWNLSGLVHVSERVQALLELDGSGGISGEAVGEDVVNLSPGLRVRLLPRNPLVLGTSVGLPLADEEPFDVRWQTSLFWHF